MDAYKHLVFPREQMFKIKTEYWLSSNVFTLPWWIMIFFLTVPWLVWWKLLDKRRIKEVSLYGTFIIFLSALYDSIGSKFNLWVYPYILTPLSEKFEPYDYSVLPVLYMIIYQKCKNWRSFITAQFIASAILSFIIEPITIYFEIYIMLSWRYEYSFFIYPLTGIMCRLLICKINRIEGE
jgi:hypothetical protein